jgi:hypothetical protein
MSKRLAAILTMASITKPEPVMDIDPASYERREANRKVQRELKRAQYQRNPASSLLAQANRRATRLQRMPKWADRKAIAHMFEEARRLSRETGVRHSVDHLIPLQGESVSGLHVHYNMRVIPMHKNSSKGNRIDDALMVEMGIGELR